MIPLLILLLAAMPAAAQRGGCGLGLGIEALRGAEAPLRAGAEAPSLLAGREAAGQAADRLTEAAAWLTGCRCAQAAGQAREAAGLAEELRGAAELERIRRGMDRARFSARLARERLDRQGCS
ncbi:hypothetical protein JMJ55_06545 [Belnapia sp. T6]|uniref:Antifreeze protein n=1 Tax=Belnapia mucosa TaxID=2804532 RepID=A0ABS1UZV1_9PROT|nr:hypothetical protein [Belnapia mucosa]MBL6454975.1 hypothetical protein [Belnapia mucosa]